MLMQINLFLIKWERHRGRDRHTKRETSIEKRQKEKIKTEKKQIKGEKYVEKERENETELKRKGREE